MVKPYQNPSHGYEPAPIEPNKTQFKYTLFVNGSALLNWDDIEPLRKALDTVRPGRGTFIQYNQRGIEAYEANGPVLA